MSTNRCSDPSCLNGNCEGCKDGQQFCNDPRCYPNCPDCPKPSSSTSSGDWVIILIILILAGVLLIMGILTGFDYWNKTKQAAEPKNITIHKHVQQVMEPPAPAPTLAPAPTPMTDDFSLKSCPSSRFSNDFTLNQAPSCPLSESIQGFE